MLPIIKAPPTSWAVPSVSAKMDQPRNAAIKGFIAVKRPAFSADAYFWAMGCKVKPKTEQIRTKAKMTSHSIGCVGRARVPWNKEPPHYIELGIAMPSLTHASPAVRKFIAYVQAGIQSR